MNTYDFDSFSPPSKHELAVMHDRSPIRYAADMKTPCLILLGGKDRRVPMCQGIELYHALRVRLGSNVKCMIFPEDNHPIDNPQSEVAHWTAVKEWFTVHCCKA